MAVNIRSINTDELNRFMRDCESIAWQHEVEIVNVISFDPACINLDSKLTQSFIAELKEFSEELPEPYISQASHDGRFFAQAGIDTIAIYPRGGGQHGPDEWMRREDLPRFAALIERFIRKEAKV